MCQIFFRMKIPSEIKPLLMFLGKNTLLKQDYLIKTVVFYQTFPPFFDVYSCTETQTSSNKPALVWDYVVCFWYYGDRYHLFSSCFFQSRVEQKKLHNLDYNNFIPPPAEQQMFLSLLLVVSTKIVDRCQRALSHRAHK